MLWVDLDQGTRPSLDSVACMHVYSTCVATSRLRNDHPFWLVLFEDSAFGHRDMVKQPCLDEHVGRVRPTQGRNGAMPFSKGTCTTPEIDTYLPQLPQNCRVSARPLLVLLSI